MKLSNSNLITILVILILILLFILFITPRDDEVTDEITELDEFTVYKIDNTSIRSSLTWEPEVHSRDRNLISYRNTTKFKVVSDPIITDINPDIYDMIHFGNGKMISRETDQRLMPKSLYNNKEFPNIPSRWEILNDAFRFSKYLNRIRIQSSQINIPGRQIYIINNFYNIWNFYNKIPELNTNTYMNVTLRRSVIIEPHTGVTIEGNYGWDPERWPILYPGDGLVLTLVSRNRWRITKFFNTRHLQTAQSFDNPPDYIGYTNTIMHV